MWSKARAIQYFPLECDHDQLYLLKVITLGLDASVLFNAYLSVVEHRHNHSILLGCTALVTTGIVLLIPS